MFEKIAMWQDNVIKNSIKNEEPEMVTNIKAFGVGAVEGVVIGCAFLGAVEFIVAGTKGVVKLFNK